MPRRPQSLITCSTAAPGTATIARSTGSGSETTDGYARRRWTQRRCGFTGCSTPGKCAATMLRSTAPPTEPGRSLAPTTATDRGASTCRRLATSAARSRRSTAAWAAGVGASPITTWVTSNSVRRSTGKPASLNTFCIRPFPASVSATKDRIPACRATAARCSSSSVPTPRCWWSSATSSATSASAVRPSRVQPAIPTTVPCSSATSAISSAPPCRTLCTYSAPARRLRLK